MIIFPLTLKSKTTWHVENIFAMYCRKWAVYYTYRKKCVDNWQFTITTCIINKYLLCNTRMVSPFKLSLVSVSFPFVFERPLSGMQSRNQVYFNNVYMENMLKRDVSSESKIKKIICQLNSKMIVVCKHIYICVLKF